MSCTKHRVLYTGQATCADCKELAALKARLAEQLEKYDKLHDQRHKYARALDEAHAREARLNARLAAAEAVIAEYRHVTVRHWCLEAPGDHHIPMKKCRACRIEQGLAALDGGADSPTGLDDANVRDMRLRDERKP